MKVLVVGGGGREHALAWKAAQSPRVHRVFVAPGNAGTAREGKVENVSIGAGDIEGLLEFARAEAVDLTIVGPEAPLVAGIADRFEAAGLRIFGPNRCAARLEASKAFAKDFLARHSIPTAASRVFDQPEPALDYIRARGAPIVVKADGLAGGKGVVVAQSVEAACEAASAMLSGGAFGDAGRRVVVEEFLDGEEASFIAIVGGGRVLPLATSQDHKPVGDGDTGPNTGGMGAYSPALLVDTAIHRRILAQVIEPTVRGLESEGLAYTGFLYAGLMIDRHGAPRVLEYNCRGGDPEIQPIMMRLRSDLIDLCEAAVDARLDRVEARWDERAALGVVMASRGYPGKYPRGEAIAGLKRRIAETKVFHAGTRLDGTKVLTDGGRVLCVCALGKDVRSAKARAYKRVGTISWPNAYFRRDIGVRGDPQLPLPFGPAIVRESRVGRVVDDERVSSVRVKVPVQNNGSGQHVPRQLVTIPYRHGS